MCRAGAGHRATWEEQVVGASDEKSVQAPWLAFPQSLVGMFQGPQYSSWLCIVQLYSSDDGGLEPEN